MGANSRLQFFGLGMEAASCHCESRSNLSRDCFVPRNDRYSAQPDGSLQGVARHVAKQSAETPKIIKRKTTSVEMV